MQALNGGSAFIAGAFGTLLSTRNGGANWLKHNIAWTQIVPRLMIETGPVEPNLNTVYFVDDQRTQLIPVRLRAPIYGFTNFSTNRSLRSRNRHAEIAGVGGAAKTGGLSRPFYLAWS